MKAKLILINRSCTEPGVAKNSLDNLGVLEAGVKGHSRVQTVLGFLGNLVLLILFFPFREKICLSV